MSKSYEWNILGRKMHVYVSNLNDERGSEKGWHKRIALYLGGDDDGKLACSLEYHVPSWRFGMSFRATHDEAPIKASLHTGLFSVYLGVAHPVSSKIRDAIVRMWPLPERAYSFSGRDFDISFHDYAVYWSIGGDDMGWSSRTPRWRDGAWHPFGHHMRQGEPEVLEARDVLVPMFERAYRAHAELHRTRWGFTKLPRFFDRIDRHVRIKMYPNEQIPIPGKGENSYDCGEDAIFESSAPGETIEDGIGHLIGSVLRSRMRHGGPNWKPEVKTAGANAQA